MATQVTKWQSKLGLLFDTEVEANYADRKADICEFLDKFHDDGDRFDVDTAVEALLVTYNMAELPK